MAEQIQIPPGSVTCTTYGSIRGETARCLMEMRSFSEEQGLRNCSWDMVPGGLVEKARNDAVRQMLGRGQQWILFVDGDMVFGKEALLQLLTFAYAPNSPADVVGAYCTLKGDLCLPTIDSGTGTWESVYPGIGPIEVMRTGAAFILAKRHVFERLPDPWFKMRVPARPVDFMGEVDNWARMKLNGKNPFRNLPGEPWEKLEEQARVDPSAHRGNFVPAEVGEDSAFCDAARNRVIRLFVHTDVIVGHLETVTKSWTDHKSAMEKMKVQHRQLCGVLS